MEKLIIAYDMGTGGIKSSLISETGNIVFSSFSSYETYYPFNNFHDQKPDDWWNGIISSSKKLIERSGIDVDRIEALSISGHSLGVVPVDKKGNLLREFTPIWSDTRSENQTRHFFKTVDYENWYNTTGNGFPPECYSVFKIMWYKENEPEMYKNIYKILGTKDYCNLRLTGEMKTDHSYASGSGVYSLKNNDYLDNFIEKSGIDRALLPDIIRSSDIVGTLTPEASRLTGLPQKVKVVCGGVDNSCMALGARGIKNGRIYTSVGSSAWIAITSDKPILDFKYKPFVFAHVIDGMYASATSVFSAGNSLRWVRDVICRDLIEKEESGGGSAYEMMDILAGNSPIGANKLIFNPSLAGGSMIEESPYIRGGYAGLTLGHRREDLIRAAIEGISFNLRHALDILGKYEAISPQMLVVGGGAKSKLWRNILSNVYGMDILKTNIDQDAATLGAAAVAAYGIGIWKDYDIIDNIHKTESTEHPVADNIEQYENAYRLYNNVTHHMAEIGIMIENTKK